MKTCVGIVVERRSVSDSKCKNGIDVALQLICYASGGARESVPAAGGVFRALTLLHRSERLNDIQPRGPDGW